MRPAGTEPSSGDGNASNVAAAKQEGTDADEIERLIETDLTLVPKRSSAMLVEPSVLDPQEVQALLADLGALLQAAAVEAATVVAAGAHGSAHASTHVTGGPAQQNFEGARYESHASAVGRHRRDSKLSPLAWLFPDHAGAGRPARNEQGHHLRT